MRRSVDEPTETFASASDTDLVVEIPRCELSIGFLMLDDAPVPLRRWDEPSDDDSEPTSPVRLHARRRAFGWTLSMRAEVRDPGAAAARWVERIVHHETVTHEAVVTLHEVAHASLGHACEDDGRFAWLATAASRSQAFFGRDCRAKRGMHIAHRRLERHRLEALDAADSALWRIRPDARSLAGIPPFLHDAVLEAMHHDPSGRLAEIVVLRPATMRAISIALGDRPSAWVPSGRLAAPLAILQAGARDRDALAAAIEVGCRVPPTEARVSRLRTFGARMSDSSERLAYVAACLDVECPPSWLPSRELDLELWAMAQCWGRTVALPSAADRYLARYGVDIGHILGRGRQRRRRCNLLAEVLRVEAAAALKRGLSPACVLRHRLAQPFPVLPGLATVAEENGIELRRLDTSGALRDAGRRYENCLSAQAEQYAEANVDGESAHYEARWLGGGCVVDLVAMAGDWAFREIVGPRNAPLSEGQVRRVEDAVRAMMERESVPKTAHCAALVGIDG